MQIYTIYTDLLPLALENPDHSISHFLLKEIKKYPANLIDDNSGLDSCLRLSI